MSKRQIRWTQRRIDEKLANLVKRALDAPYRNRWKRYRDEQYCSKITVWRASE